MEYWYLAGIGVIGFLHLIANRLMLIVSELREIKLYAEKFTSEVEGLRDAVVDTEIRIGRIDDVLGEYRSNVLRARSTLDDEGYL